MRDEDVHSSLYIYLLEGFVQYVCAARDGTSTGIGIDRVSNCKLSQLHVLGSPSAVDLLAICDRPNERRRRWWYRVVDRACGSERPLLP